MTHPLVGPSLAPNLWAQFSVGALHSIVHRLYPDFGSDQIRTLPTYTLIELIDIKKRAGHGLNDSRPIE